MSRTLIRATSALAIALSLAVSHAHATAVTASPTTEIQPFEVEGIAHYQAGKLTVNGVELQLDNTSKFEDWWLGKSTLNGRWVKVEGFHQDGRFQVSEIDGENRDNDVELTGLVQDNRLWGFQGMDNSLLPFNNQWVQLECQLSIDGHRISQCHLEE